MAMLREGFVGGQGRTEPSPLLLPDSPGACEVGVSLAEGEGGPTGAQELSYFCNTEYVCSSRREGQTLGAGLECRGQAAGGAAVSPLLAAWRAPALPFGEGGATHSEAHGVGRDTDNGDGVVHWRGFGEWHKFQIPIALRWGGI